MSEVEDSSREILSSIDCESFFYNRRPRVKPTRRSLLHFLLGASVLGISFASTLAQNDPLQQEREKVSLSCRRLAKAIGQSYLPMEQAIRKAVNSDELSGILQYCDTAQTAYPTQALDEPAIARGRELYTNLGCAICHGHDARGGESGPSLLRSQRLLRDKKGETIGEIVLNGIPNTLMPSFRLTAEQLSDVSAFLHGLQVKHLETPRNEGSITNIGDAKAGETYFAQKCQSCHSVKGDLEGIGAKYEDIRTLQQQWLAPESHFAKTAVIPLSNGSHMEAPVLHMDEFLITLRLADGSHRTLEVDGTAPKLHIRDRLAGHKALLSAYTDADIHNVTAYLHALQPLAKGGIGESDASAGAPPDAVRERGSPGQTGLGPESIVHPILGTWPTYSGDYTGRRYSPLSQINHSNVRHLTLAWTTRLTSGSGDYPIRTGGEGGDDRLAKAPAEVRGSMLQVGGSLYLSTPDNAWAVDARSGEILWNFRWKSRGGWHQFGSRGPAMLNSSIYFETPDDYLVSLDAVTGNERWHVQIASIDEQYFASVAPMVIGNHVLVGAGNTLNAPGFLESFDPDTGHLQWKHYSVPMNKGDPGIETWKDLDAARHGGGQVWIPGAYDPKTRLYIYGTGNPSPAFVASARGNREALFTCSILAVNVDSGNLIWYYQTSPNDTHDWDSAQTPVLEDVIVGGHKREVAMTAARNGYFFVVDRNTGIPILTRKFSNTINWATTKLNATGQPIRIPEKDGTADGVLVSNDILGATNWQPASYSPQYGLFYVQAAESWALSYKTDSDAGGAYSMEGKEEAPIDSEAFLKAIDPKNGRIAWSIKYPSGHPLANGVLTTAGRLLFAGDTAGNLVARDPADGRPLWHTRLGQVSNAPETYMLDKHQFVLVASGDTLFAFRLQ